MASSLEPVILTFLAGAAIAKGKAVKFGSDDKHVIIGAAATDDVIGIAQSAATAAEDLVEVAVAQGAKGLAQTSITRGMLLVSHTDGALKPIAAANDRVIGVAMESAAASDLFDVLITHAQGTATE